MAKRYEAIGMSYYITYVVIFPTVVLFLKTALIETLYLESTMTDA
jgi:hypothetical protein